MTPDPKTPYLQIPEEFRWLAEGQLRLNGTVEPRLQYIAEALERYRQDGT